MKRPRGKRLKILLTVAAGALVVATAESQRVVITNSGAATGNLLQWTDFTYAGAFRYSISSNGYDSGGAEFSGIAYDAAGNGGAGSLYVSNTYANRFAEINIPTLNTDVNATIAALNVATNLQVFPANNPTDTNWDTWGTQLNDGTCDSGDDCPDMSASFIWDGKWWGQWGDTYNNGNQTNTFWNRSTKTLSTSSVASEMFHLTVDTGQGVGGYSAYTTEIPDTDSWRTRLGGTHLSGQFFPSIITRFGYGPSLYAWSPLDYTGSNHPNATALLNYPTDALSLAFLAGATPYITGSGECVSPGCYYLSTNLVWTSISTGTPVFPSGHDSVLFVNRFATGDVAYCQPPQNTDPEAACYDPETTSSGQATSSYGYQAMFYDANDLEEVKNGSRTRYSVMPYAYGEISLPPNLANWHHKTPYVAHDPTNKRIFIKIIGSYLSGAEPIILVYSYP
jgi:hypothetical protein